MPCSPASITEHTPDLFWIDLHLHSGPQRRGLLPLLSSAPTPHSEHPACEDRAPTHHTNVPITGTGHAEPREWRRQGSRHLSLTHPPACRPHVAPHPHAPLGLCHLLWTNPLPAPA